MIKLAKKIISKPNPDYDSSGQGKYANPIDAYLKEVVAFRLSRLCQSEYQEGHVSAIPVYFREIGQ